MTYSLHPIARVANQTNPNNYTAYGQAIIDRGLVVQVAINGVGLLTRGFIWQGPEVWFWPQDVDGIATGWTAASGYSGSATLITTGWTASAGYSGCAAASLISTSWTMSKSGVYGEFPSS